MLLLPMIVATAALAALTGEDALVCRYDPDRNGSQVILRPDGSIRFVSEDVADKDSVMKADAYHRTSTNVRYRMVMVGRTDTFDVSLKTLHGTQRISHSNGEQEKLYHLICDR
jgi:hypothetical protein